MLKVFWNIYIVRTYMYEVQLIFILSMCLLFRRSQNPFGKWTTKSPCLDIHVIDHYGVLWTKRWDPWQYQVKHLAVWNPNTRHPILCLQHWCLAHCRLGKSCGEWNSHLVFLQNQHPKCYEEDARRLLGIICSCWSLLDDGSKKKEKIKFIF